MNFLDRSSLLFALLLLLFVSLPLPASAAADQPEDKGATPAAVVSFQQPALSQNESAIVEVWFSNPSPNDMSVDLTISSSSLIKWLDASCKTAVSSPTPLGPVAATSSVHRTFCAKAAPEVVVGDYNILFSFVYRTLADPKKAGLVSVEKSLRLSFLGSDSVAGIPLAFSCFIVPGFLFWLALKLTNSFGVEPQLGDKMIYSILVSLLIIAGGSLFHQFSLSAGVSIQKLTWLSLAGIVAGLALGVGKRTWTWHANRTLVTPTDSEQTVLEKLLERNRSLRKPLAVVTLKTNDAYEGALYAQTDTHTVLIGWFSFEPPPPNAEEIRRLAERHRFHEIVRWADHNHIKVNQYRPLRRRKNGNSQDTSEYLKSWKNDEVEDARQTANASGEEPLVIS